MKMLSWTFPGFIGKLGYPVQLAKNAKEKFMISMSHRRLCRINPLVYEKVVEEVVIANMTPTWFAWNNLCDVAYIGISRSDLRVSIAAVYNLGRLFDVLERTVGQHSDVKAKISEVHELLREGEQTLALYWIGQLRPIICQIQETFKDIKEPYRQQLYEGVQSILGPPPPTEAAA